MSNAIDDAFLNSLVVVTEFSAVADPANYTPVPEDWVIALSDVVDSSSAIDAGRYKAVNMAGVSVISALLNALGRSDYPYAFGGDGASVALPGSAKTHARDVLAAVKGWAKEALELELRVALVHVHSIRAAGQDVRVLRLGVSPDVSYAMFSGGGISWAESEMKVGHFHIEGALDISAPDLTGLSCRWDPIPASKGQIVSLIVVPGDQGAGDAFRHLILTIVGLMSEQQRQGHPLPAEGPPLRFTTSGLKYEAAALAPGGSQLWKKILVVSKTVAALLLDRLNLEIGGFNAKRYKAEVSANSDFRKFDDGLKMTVDIRDEQFQAIEKILQEAAQRRCCRYGIHRQDNALMTCFVPSISARDHVHFIDGAGGGYALAARNLKQNFPLSAA
ncbi:DUF3095 domain-containing protein [Rhizobium sp. PL01]|uniref:DUF3095 domain-containing protein n=1 Tax=Rhizobium sp. PL01 TaxID=3085631 RepID=UPI002982493A|nr:DUF3095 domain-containing protein [Rhizobium sp. PL01]MDW5315853.1 DUF3095 domain-containing protein [Rhizobium sp. PL01]